MRGMYYYLNAEHRQSLDLASRLWLYQCPQGNPTLNTAGSEDNHHPPPGREPTGGGLSGNWPTGMLCWSHKARREEWNDKNISSHGKYGLPCEYSSMPALTAWCSLQAYNIFIYFPLPQCSPTVAALPHIFLYCLCQQPHQLLPC